MKAFYLYETFAEAADHADKREAPRAGMEYPQGLAAVLIFEVDEEQPQSRFKGSIPKSFGDGSCMLLLCRHNATLKPIFHVVADKDTKDVTKKYGASTRACTKMGRA